MKHQIFINQWKKIPLNIVNDINFVIKDLRLINPIYKKTLDMGFNPDNPNHKIKKYISLYKLGLDYIEVPRHYSVDIKDDISIDDIEIKNEIPNKPISFDFTLETNDRFDKYQVPAINTILDKKEGILLAVPASGKTYMCLRLIDKIKQKTMILVPTKYIKEQWIDLLRSKTNAKILTISGAPKSEKKWKECDIAIATIHSFFRVPEDHPIFKEFPLLIVDEAHLISADKFNETAIKFNSTRIATTGTIKEKNPILYKVISSHFGDILYEISYKDTLAVKPIIEKHNVRCRLNASNYLSMAKYFTAIWYDDTFLNDIIEEINILVNIENYKNTLIITDRRVATGKLYNKLINNKNFEGIKIGTADQISECYKCNTIFSGVICPQCKCKTDKKHSHKIIRKAVKNLEELNNNDIIIATHNKLGLGYSNPNLDAMVLISYMSSPEFSEQIVGRVTRYRPGKTNVYILELATKGPLEVLSQRRHNHWHKLGWL